MAGMPRRLFTLDEVIRPNRIPARWWRKAFRASLLLLFVSGLGMAIVVPTGIYLGALSGNEPEWNTTRIAILVLMQGMVAGFIFGIHSGIRWRVADRYERKQQVIR